MSVPRRFRVVRAEDLLAVDPHLLRGRRLPEGQVQRRQAVQAQEEEPQLAEARPVPRPPQAPQSPEPPFPRRQGRVGPHPQIPELLREGSQEGHPGHLRTLLQQDLEGRRLVRPPVLRPGLQHAGGAIRGALPLQIRVVLLRQVQDVRHQRRRPHLQVMFRQSITPTASIL